MKQGRGISLEQHMLISRVWAMPSADTFDCPPIGEMVKRYLRASRISIDPFARNKNWATYTNDLNPKTEAQCHMDACDFLKMLLDKDVRADLIIFDPPYSHYQTREVYQSVGRPYRFNVEAANMGHWTKEKRICAQLLTVDGYFLHFGWHSNGLGKGRHAQIEEILLVAHGRAHNDTICMAERKIA